MGSGNVRFSRVTIQSGRNKKTKGRLRDHQYRHPTDLWVDFSYTKSTVKQMVSYSHNNRVGVCKPYRAETCCYNARRKKVIFKHVLLVKLQTNELVCEINGAFMGSSSSMLNIQVIVLDDARHTDCPYDRCTSSPMDVDHMYLTVYSAWNEAFHYIACRIFWYLRFRSRIWELDYVQRLYIQIRLRCRRFCFANELGYITT